MQGDLLAAGGNGSNVGSGGGSNGGGSQDKQPAAVEADAATAGPGCRLLTFQEYLEQQQHAGKQEQHASVP